MVRKKEPFHSFSVNFPKSLVEEIDQICSSQYITRTSWLIKAAMQLIQSERLLRTDDLLAKIASKE